MASTYLSRAGGTPTSTRKFTISFWVKKSGQGADSFLVSSFTDASNRMQVNLNSDDTIDFVCKVSGSNVIRKKPTRILRDPSAFYHVTVAVDTTLGTAADRCKFYINGVQETSFSSETNPSQNADVNVSGDHFIGAYDNGGSPALFFDGLMTHIHYTDGYTYQASDFGESDSVSGIWKPKTSPSVTYGSNGFFLKFENSGAMGTDSSGNSNTFTVGGTLTQNVDTPSNNFVTFNPLRPNSISQTYSNGNNTFIRTGTGGQMNGTLGVTSGKWYYECLLDDYWQYLGWTALSLNTSQTAACSDSGSGFYGLYSNASEVYTYANGSNTSQGSYTAMASGQFWGIAFDADNAKMYFSVNGVWENSSDPANQTNPAMSSIPVTDFLVPAIGQGTGSRSSTIKLNFGSGYFGTTVAGTNADANGHGKFKYSVPSGYYTLNTKNIKEFG